MLDLATVRHRLVSIAERDPEFTVFGSEVHHYQLAPPLAAQAIADVEAGLGVRLPEDYRRFLEQVGNGGAGPGFGLTPLETAIHYVESRNHEAASTSAIAEPFPVSQPIMGYEELEAYDGPEINRGVLNLGGYGCGIDPYLVVSGERAGQVWMLDLASDGGVYPFTIPESGHLHDFSRAFPETVEEMTFDAPLSFGDWYGDWLQSVEAALQGS